MPTHPRPVPRIGATPVGPRPLRSRGRSRSRNRNRARCRCRSRSHDDPLPASRPTAASAAAAGTAVPTRPGSGTSSRSRSAGPATNRLRAPVRRGSETLTVSAVEPVAQGRSVTVDEGSSSTIGTTSVPTNAAFHYILTSRGQLISVPSGLQVAGQPYSITGDTTYPSVKTLLSGGKTVSHLHIDCAAQPGGSRRAARRPSRQVHLARHGRRRRAARAVRSRPSRLLWARSTMCSSCTPCATSIAFTNIGKAASRELAGAVLPTISKELSSTTWYAPGLGPIKD